MPFIPHTAEEAASMLATIGVDSTTHCLTKFPLTCGPGKLTRCRRVSEMQMLPTLGACEPGWTTWNLFPRGWQYDHHIPAAVWDLTAAVNS